MPAYSTPGVYYERVDATAPAISVIRTDVPGFVGISVRGPLDMAVPIQSWRQFQAHFGEFTGAGFLAYSVRGFFENGGRRCWVVRVASKEPLGGAASAQAVLQSETGQDILRVAASSPGVWGNDLSVTVKETHRAEAVTDQRQSQPESSTVSSVSGFKRGTMVRLSQDAAPQIWKVVSDVDPIERRLIWINDDPRNRLPYDSPLTGFDLNRPVLIQSVEYTFIVRRAGNPIALFEGLSLVPEHDDYGPRVLAPITFSSSFDPTQVLPLAPPPICIEELRQTPLIGLGPIQVSAQTTLANIIDPTHIQLGSSAGIVPRAALELLDPQNTNNLIGEPLTVISIDPPPTRTITLDGSGLSAGQQAAQVTAIAAGMRLVVRLRGLQLEERLLNGGVDGMALLQTYDFIGEEITPVDSDEAVFQKRRGLRALEIVDEVAIVAIPDINIQPIRVPPKDPPKPCQPDVCLPNQPIPVAVPRSLGEQELPPTFSEGEIFRVQAAMVEHCEARRDRIAILDPPFGASRDDQLGVGAIRAWRSRFESKYAALYYPWLRVVDPLRNAASSVTRDIPASGHVSGQYARTDIAVGVHKAPANDPLSWIQDVTVPVSDAVHGILNPAGINVVRVLPGRGIRIMGARTVSSDPDWRYVNVRRLMMMIEEAIDVATQWAAFEPNDFYTRAKLTLAISSFLIELWQKGALAGKSIEAAFFVKCDETNNPPSQREQGRLVADVGVAPSNPFEFIVLRVGRTDNEFEISEYPIETGGGN